ncbi:MULTISPECIES: RES family NAD+ phosphorylase [Methylobacterium]|uniref:RES family NAD+ phosphorylase n=1 Tax=Methylobacterium TaxID=407 RepID=UPI0013EC3572|nr:RES family NAD+ phosphorylase [Methylobacterium sp. DB0501]NGM37034.1 RES family NAD+ phosphorylase [Methylobacterium sp. DB0501]
MILTSFVEERIFYRYLTPRWSHQPLSGAGAAMNGGRFNPKGVSALYLSADPETALAELRQDALLAPPATLAAYKVIVGDIVDFAGGFDSDRWSPDWSDWNCDWKYMSRIERKMPQTWRLSNEIIGQQCRGLLFPSTRKPGGTNLVLFSDHLTQADKVEVHDPNGDLPRNQLSWNRNS